MMPFYLPSWNFTRETKGIFGKHDMKMNTGSSKDTNFIIV